MSAECFFEAGNGGAQIIRRSSPLLTAWRSISSQVFFPVQDPADRNRHARHLDVIPTLIARFEGLWLGPGGSWTVQAVISSARNSNDGANHSILAAASLRLATTTRYYDVVLWRSYNT